MSWDPTHTLYFSGGHALKATKAASTAVVRVVRQRRRCPTSYSETSGLEGSQVNNEPTDAPGTFVAFTSDPLSAPADVVGSPKVTLRAEHADAPATPRSADPSGQLVLFAKIYDIAPDGSKVLKNRMVAPLRVHGHQQAGDAAAARASCTASRPGTGSRWRSRRATAAYAGNTLPQPVTIMTGPNSGSTLGLPVVGKLAF